MKKQRGEILIEALLGLVITSIIVTGLVVALNSSVSNSIFSTNQSQATLIAKEGLDLVKNIKEDDYLSVSNLATGYYHLNSSRVLVPGCCESVTVDGIEFSRQFYINSIGLDQRKTPVKQACNNAEASVFAASIVSWSDSKCGPGGAKCHKIELDSCFADLSQI